MEYLFFMLLSVSSSCAAELGFPEEGTSFVYDAPGLHVFEQILEVNTNGLVSYRLGVAPNSDSPPNDSRTDFHTIAGILPIGDRQGNQYRELVLPSDVMADISRMETNTQIEFEVGVRAMLNGERFNGRDRLTVVLDRCAVLDTPAGRFEVQRYRVNYPTVSHSGGEFQRGRAERLVDYAPALGWPVFHDYGEAGSATLVRVE